MRVHYYGDDLPRDKLQPITQQNYSSSAIYYLQHHINPTLLFRIFYILLVDSMANFLDIEHFHFNYQIKCCPLDQNPQNKE